MTWVFSCSKLAVWGWITSLWRQNDYSADALRVVLSRMASWKAWTQASEHKWTQVNTREHKQHGLLEHKQVNTSEHKQHGLLESVKQAAAASEFESTCFPSSATNPNSEQSILRSSCSFPSSHGTSYLALKKPKQSRQSQGSPTGLQHDANVASRHDRSARLMVLDHWSIPLYPCTPLCYICWSVPLYPTIADLHLTAHVE